MGFLREKIRKHRARQAERTAKKLQRLQKEGTRLEGRATLKEAEMMERGRIAAARERMAKARPESKVVGFLKKIEAARPTVKSKPSSFGIGMPEPKKKKFKTLKIGGSLGGW